MGRFRTILTLSLLACFPAVAGAANGADWALKDYAYRRAINIDDLPAGATVCHVRFAHQGSIQPSGNDIRITDAAGAVVNHEILRLGPGTQAEVLFECNAAKAGSVYYVYFGNSTVGAPKKWIAEAGIVLEIRKKGEGAIDTWPNYQKLFSNSSEVEGRTLRHKIFDGYNVLGPNLNFLSFYRAYFKTETAGNYKFATNSDDASFVLVNDKLVASFPGGHNANANMGQHSGAIDLKAGVNKLEYYHCQIDNEMATCCAWQRPGDKFYGLMEDAAFLPIGRAKSLAIEAADKRPLLDFTWAPRDHLVVNGRYIIRYAFECAAPVTGTVHWEFGDGTTLTSKKDGPVLSESHGFLSAGLFTVTLSADGSSPPVKQVVSVEPIWRQREEWDDGRWNEYRKGIVARLEAGLSRAHETTTVLNFAASLGDKRLIELCAAAAWPQAKQFSAIDQVYVFYTLGHRLQKEVKDYAGADRAFQEVIAGPGDRIIKEQAKLHRAGLLIHMRGHDQEALEILKKIDDTALLPPNEPLLRQIYMADACAGLGQADEAAKRYDALRPVVNMADRAYAIGRRSRLLSINSWIKKGDYESALQQLQNIEWETPKERMSDETGMLRAECYLAQEDFDLAAILLRRLVNVNATSARMPEMLFGLLKAYRGLKQNDKVDETFARMKKEHPYAAETALAALLLSK